jgi:hypothetical protein
LKNLPPEPRQLPLFNTENQFRHLQKPSFSNSRTRLAPLPAIKDVENEDVENENYF